MVLSVKNFYASVVAVGGTGVLTLGADIFTGLGSITPGVAAEIDYIAFDGTSIEWGVGTVNAAGTTFTRDTISGTIVGTTRDESSPAALDLNVGTKLHWQVVHSSAFFGYAATLNQDVSTAASPTFAGLTLTKAGVLALSMLNSTASVGLDLSMDADAARITAIAATKLGLGAGGTDDILVLNTDGSLDVSGVGTFTGLVTGNDGALLTGAATANARFTFTQTTAGLSGQIQQGSGGFALSALGAQSLLFYTNGVTALTIDSSQNATFAAAITTQATGTASAVLSLDNNGTSGRQYDIGSSSTGYGSAGKFYIYDVTAGAERFSIDLNGDIAAAGDATFAGDIKAGGMINLGTPSELTIVSAAITVTKSFHSVDTELDAATDDLETINGGSTGDYLELFAADSARTVVLKDGIGNLRLSGDCSLDTSDDSIALRKRATGNWHEVSRSNNA